jgi:hypothetical protein
MRFGQIGDQWSAGEAGFAVQEGAGGAGVKQIRAVWCMCSAQASKGPCLAMHCSESERQGLYIGCTLDCSRIRRSGSNDRDASTAKFRV